MNVKAILERISVWWQYSRISVTQALVFVIGNLWRLIVCNISNLVRYIYFRIKSKGEYDNICANECYVVNTADGVKNGSFHYSYDGFAISIFGKRIRIKWPTYTRTVADYIWSNFYGNCDCYAHFVKSRLKMRNDSIGKKSIVHYIRTRIYIVGLDITKIHYLVEVKYHDLTEGVIKYITFDITKSGSKITHMSARDVMESRNQGSIVYTVW